ncbi:Uncharacterised protein [Mycobacteroides abscessus subsp. abscessus]|nr:Uncharacterised protein [Mycobacteroides abscessus subsp. abscessus]
MILHIFNTRTTGAIVMQSISIEFYDRGMLEFLEENISQQTCRPTCVLRMVKRNHQGQMMKSFVI